MSVWWNATDKPLCFSFRGEVYNVPPGGEVTMSDAWDWLPPKRGLPLTMGHSPAASIPRVIPTAPEPAKKTFPAGVTAGDRPVQREWDDDGEGFAEAGSVGSDADDVADVKPESEAVAKTVERLKKQGVKVPGKR